MTPVTSQFKEIAFRGVTTSPNDYACQDGDLSLSIGLQNQDGALSPAPASADAGFILPAGYRLMYIHKQATYTNYIIWGGNTDLRYINVNDDGYIAKLKEVNDLAEQMNSPQSSASVRSRYEGAMNQLMNDYMHPISIPAIPTQIISMGNVLTILHEAKPVTHVIYKDGAYYSFEIPDDIHAQFTLRGKLAWYDIKNVALQVTEYNDREYNIAQQIETLKLSMWKKSSGTAYPLKYTTGMQGYMTEKTLSTALKKNTWYRFDVTVTFSNASAASQTEWGEKFGNVIGLYTYNDTAGTFTGGTAGNAVGNELEDGRYRVVASMYTYLSDDTDFLEIIAGCNDTIPSNLQVYADILVYEGKDVGQYMLTDASKVNFSAALDTFVKEQGTDKNKFTEPFFLRYGYELFDGTVGYASAPILMLPNTNLSVFLRGLSTEGEITSASSSHDVSVYGAACDIVMNIKNDITALQEKGIVKNLIIAVSKDIVPYDSTSQDYYVKNVGDNFTEDYNFSFCSLEDENTYTIDDEGNTVINRKDPCKHGNINMYNNYYLGQHTYSHDGIVQLPSLDWQDFCDRIVSQDMAAYYIVKRIPVEELVKGDTVLEFDDGKLSALTNQEQMALDSITYNKLIAKTAINYNSRINLANVKEQLFQGWNPAEMHCITHETYTSTDAFSYDNAYYADVTVSVNNETYTIRTPFSFKNDTPLMWFYSPLDVKSVTVYGYAERVTPLYPPSITSGKYLTKISLNVKKHPILPGYYAIADSWNGFAMQERTISDYDFAVETAERATEGLTGGVTPTVVSYPNKLYLSNVSDPLTYSLANVTYIGTGSIIGIATAAKPISQGQFGQFPLYIFTDEGVYALEVGSTGTYSAAKPLTRDVCINADSITALDDAVVFATSRGIIMLQGGQTACITDNLLRTANFTALISDLKALAVSAGTTLQAIAPALSNMSAYLDSEIDFHTFFQECSIMYDYANQRLLFYTETEDIYGTLMLVYSLSSNTWMFLDKDISYKVNNYPDAYAVSSDGSTLVNLSNRTEPTASTPGILVTRPLTFDGQSTVKQLEQLRINGVLGDGEATFAVYVSNDLLTWTAITSSKHLNLLYNEGTPWRYYRLIVITALKPGHSLNSFTVRYKVRDSGNLLV